jgi:hypothetical protein
MGGCSLKRLTGHPGRCLAILTASVLLLGCWAPSRLSFAVAPGEPTQALGDPTHEPDPPAAQQRSAQQRPAQQSLEQLPSGESADVELSAGETALAHEFFERQIRPILAEHCYSCHSVRASESRGGLQLDSRAGLLAGGDSGPAVAPGNPEASLLIEAVRYEGYQMPPESQLPADQIDALQRWVALGAPWPAEPEPVADNQAAAGRVNEFDLQTRRDSHWAWQPISPPEVPSHGGSEWPLGSADLFVLAGLAEGDLVPAAATDRVSLIRRLYFDLTGLPPTAAQLHWSLDDPAPDAVDRLVDRLLATPQFGERWGRHWLDLVRYSESRGHEFDFDIPNAYHYRDYVIAGLNADVPYDRWVLEHVAGDLLPDPRPTVTGGGNASWLGTGFWWLGEWVHSPVDTRKEEADRLDNMLDVFSKTFLGLTVACARCHDHKFDAISAHDYHALRGFLTSSSYRQGRFEAAEHDRLIAEQLERLDADFGERLKRIVIDGVRHTLGDGDTTSALTPTPGQPPLAEQHSATGDRSWLTIDYADLPAGGWLQDGELFGPRPRNSGDWVWRSLDAAQPRLELIGTAAAVSDLFWDASENLSQASINGSGQLDPRLRGGRTLRTPEFTLETEFVWCLVRGEGQIFAAVDSHRLLAGPLHQQTLRNVDSGGDQPELGDQTPEWIPLDLGRYHGHRVQLEFTPSPGRQLEVWRIEQRGQDQRPPPPAGASAAADAATDPSSGLSPPPPALLAAAAAWEAGRLHQHPHAQQLASWLNRQLAERLTVEPAEPIAEPLAERSGAETEPWQAEVASLAGRWLAARLQLQQQCRPSALAPVMLDGLGHADRRFVRGNPDQPAEPVQRRFLEAIDGPEPLPIVAGSGRLQLAQRLIDPSNPLTDRVIVNRLWQHLMGRGIVATPDDFGQLGQPPTHPELLDHLAIDFRLGERSIKRSLRRLLLTQTYRMSGDYAPEQLERDPTNRLWHYRPPRRLEGESLRDTLLSLAGRLDRQLYGPPVPVALTDFLQGRGRPRESGPLDGLGRRSIYQAVRRNFLSPLLAVFDTPPPFSSMGRRNESNVPAQSLLLMNDPLVIELAAAWADRAAEAEPDSAERRIDWLFRSGLGRPVTPQELEVLLAVLGDVAQPDTEPVDPLVSRAIRPGPSAGAEMAARGEQAAAVERDEYWRAVAQAIINAKEFMLIP